MDITELLKKYVNKEIIDYTFSEKEMSFMDTKYSVILNIQVYCKTCFYYGA